MIEVLIWMIAVERQLESVSDRSRPRKMENTDRRAPNSEQSIFLRRSPLPFLLTLCTPSCPSLCGSNDPHIAICRHTRLDGFRRIFGGKTGRCHERDIGEEVWGGRDDEEGAVGHVEVAEDGPARCV